MMQKRSMTIFFTALMAFVLLFSTTSAAIGEENPSLYESFIYGTSVQGRLLTCHRIGDPNASQSLLMVFAIHGFEDSFKQDGRLLSEIANLMIEHYRADPSILGDAVLYIVPCANPDGQEEGKSQDGFGRCNADGIDINRDFPVEWKRMTSSRYRTGSEPFATQEAQALRYLVELLKPSYGVDVHGWIDRVYGTPAMAQPFMDAFGFPYAEYSSGGKLSQYMEEQMQAAVLVELPDNTRADGFSRTCADKLIIAVDQWLKQNSMQTIEAPQP